MYLSVNTGHFIWILHRHAVIYPAAHQCSPGEQDSSCSSLVSDGLFSDLCFPILHQILKWPHRQHPLHAQQWVWSEGSSDSYPGPVLCWALPDKQGPCPCSVRLSHDTVLLFNPFSNSTVCYRWRNWGLDSTAVSGRRGTSVQKCLTPKPMYSSSNPCPIPVCVRGLLSCEHKVVLVDWGSRDYAGI